MASVKRALISVSDKTNVVEFAKSLSSFGIKILSTGGTAKKIRDAGVEVTDVSDHTGFPECLDGRVKTLHPKVHGGILGRRDLDSHVAKMAELGLEPIDIVVVNLYPFEATIEKEGVTLDEAIEQIDIGGPAMIRSSAKNHRDVTVIVDPADYDVVIAEIKENDDTTFATRQRLAVKAFERTAWYDSRISSHLAKTLGFAEKLPARRLIQLEQVQSMRYGENPHQAAAFYRQVGGLAGFADVKQLHGKELSYNNIVDMAAAYELVAEFADPACAIIKHTNPCGCARADSLLEAFVEARETDPVSSFGGVVAVNRELDADAATEMKKLFLEIIIAPRFSAEAMEILTTKKNLRLIEHPLPGRENYTEPKFVRGGALVQDADTLTLDEKKLKVVSDRKPTDDEMKALKFAWTVAKHVKSNAIVYADSQKTIGVGAGQMSRVDSSKIAVSKATRPIPGTVMASDAFFPFRDSIDEAAKAGVVAIIQPGGSVRDDEVIGAANEHGMTMVFTGLRHFKH